MNKVIIKNCQGLSTTLAQRRCLISVKSLVLLSQVLMSNLPRLENVPICVVRHQTHTCYVLSCDSRGGIHIGKN